MQIEKRFYASLLLACNSLLLCGSFIAKDFDWIQVALMQWCGFCGIVIVYRYNDIIDQDVVPSFSIAKFLKQPINLFFLVQFVVISLPLFYIYFTSFRSIILASICLLGLLYTVKINANGKQFRLKNLFIVKNLIIGILWGALVIAGAGVINQAVLGVFIFTSIQVFIGSVIRDLPDVKKDKESSVRTLPVVFGIQKSINLMKLLNMVSLPLAYLVYPDIKFVLLMTLVVLWRYFVLHKVSENLASLWLQSMNLLTCSLILLASIVRHVYA